jgi:excisionase family DNA binding protein
MSELLDVTKAAEMSGMSISWWRQQIMRKKISHHKVGRRVLIDRRDIEKLIAASRVEAEV